jgi:hypothetical protein
LVDFAEEPILTDLGRPAAAYAEQVYLSGAGQVRMQPTPFIGAVSVGITPVKVWERQSGLVVDLLLQNLSVNNLYILTSMNQPTTDATVVPPFENASKDGWAGDIILVADGPASDIRVNYQAKVV